MKEKAASLKRRTFLGVASAAAVIGLAGCTRDDDPDEGDENGADGIDDGDASDNDTPLIDDWDGGRYELGLFDANRGVRDHDEWLPEWRGNNVFGLERVELDDGVHLVGQHGMGATIYDFTDGRIVYDFTEFESDDPNKFLVGGDTYGVSTTWKGRYFWGGWVMANDVDGFDVTERYAYLLETEDLEEWSIVFAESGEELGLTWYEHGYPAEVSSIVSMPSGVYFSRADDGGSGQQGNVGVYKYDGDRVSKLDDAQAWYLAGLRDEVVYEDPASEGTMVKIDVRDDSIARIDTARYEMTDRGARIDSPRYEFGERMFEVQSCLFSIGERYIDILAEAGNSIRVPYMIYSAQEGTEFGVETRKRATNRTRPISVAGGVLFAKNNMSLNHGDTKEFLTGYLSFFDGQSFQLVDKGRWIADLAIYGDHVVYGVSKSDHDGFYGVTDGLTAVQDSGTTLNRIPVDRLTSAASPPPIAEPIEYRPYAPDRWPNDGYEGLLGGLPTLGYRTVRLHLGSSESGTLRIYEWDVWRDAREIERVEYDANDELVADLSSVVTGGIVGFEFEVAGSEETDLWGTLNLQ